MGVHDKTTGWPGATGLASKRASGTTAESVSRPATSMPTCTVEPRYSTERVTPESEVASTGVDYLSVGALTHSSPILDLALDLDPIGGAAGDAAGSR